MSEEIKERLSKTDYLYMGSVRRMSKISSDENVIREVLDRVISEQSTQSCGIPISFNGRKHVRRN